MSTKLPIFDAHLHIIDPRFPLQENEGYLPPPFTVADYRARTANLNVIGGAVVSGSFQGFDQDYLTAALAELGDGFVGVTQLPAATPDSEILRLDEAGVRALRFNVRRGGSEDIDRLEAFANRVYDLAGWHVELYIDSTRLDDLYDTLLRLPAVSIDHLGLSARGLPSLLRLVERGLYVKATGFGRVDFDVAETLRALCDANPYAVMFGSDLPSTRAPRPFSDSDISLIINALGDDMARRVLCDNAKILYR